MNILSFIKDFVQFKYFVQITLFDHVDVTMMLFRSQPTLLISQAKVTLIGSSGQVFSPHNVNK